MYKCGSRTGRIFAGRLSFFCKLWETQYSEDCKKEKIVILLKKKDSGGKRV